MNGQPVQILGRTGSLFTRMPLIFAEELNVAYDFVPVADLTALEPSSYAGNPALRLPILRQNGEALFGAQNICRAIAERAEDWIHIVWPEDCGDPRSRNAHELVWHCMNAQVQLLMGEFVGNLPMDNIVFAKARVGLENSLNWLDEHLAEIMSILPENRTLSLFEVALFCLVEHLEFAKTVTVGNRPSLVSFAAAFGERPSARRTSYR